MQIKEDIYHTIEALKDDLIIDEKLKQFEEEEF
jgi:hypothetical protein